MNNKNIKAPMQLKVKTIQLMEEKLNKSNSASHGIKVPSHGIKVPSHDIKAFLHSIKAISHGIKAFSHNKKTRHRLIPALSLTVILIFIFSGFIYDYFSAIKGDDLSLNSQYLGNGIISIEVENRSHKDLQFNKAVFRNWIPVHKNTGETDYISEDLVYINQRGDKDLPLINAEMPLIPPGEKKKIIIDFSSLDYKKFETCPSNDAGFLFLLTNDDYQHGQDWTAMIRFCVPPTDMAKKENDSKEDLQDQARSNVFEVHDNTKIEFVEEIKSKHRCKPPLASIEESTPYNDLLDIPNLSLKAQKNDEIFSISDGVVEKVGFTKRQGNYIAIRHSEDFISTYTHCSKITKNKGDKVTMGEHIANVGATGRETGPFLGLSVQYKGEFINPMLLFDDI